MDQGHEIWNRNSMFGPTIPNPSAGGLPGGMVYEGYGHGTLQLQVHSEISVRDRAAVGRRRISSTPKTVIRGGWGVVYANLATYQYFTNSAILGVGIDQLSFTAPAFGEPGVVLRNGLIYNQADLYRVTLIRARVPRPGR